MRGRLRECFYSLMTDRDGSGIRGLAAAPVKFLLYILSLKYFFAVKFLAFLYAIKILNPFKARCKVISVGNITLGGTGKTPLVLTLARILRESGKRVVILSRGYKGEKNGGRSDEVELLRRHLPDVPVIVGRDRVRTAKEAVESYKADAILLDDGFQHWRLGRDLDIVTLDVGNPFGNGRLVPRGVLREPISSLRRAQVIVLTKVSPEGDAIAKAQGLKDRIKRINRDSAVFTSSYVPSRLYEVISGKQMPLSEIEGKRVALVCAIADPVSFEDTARSLGAEIALKFYFMDHHRFTKEEIRSIIEECDDKGIEFALTTEKDRERLLDAICSSGVKFYAVGIELKIDNQEKFFGRLHSLFVS